ncbi:MAG: AAC(3) family N-acetyltransferase [Armatimonadota bacterium]
MFTTQSMPNTVADFCRNIVPLLHGAVSADRLTALVEEIVATDRWNAFDRFHRTSETLLRRMREAGAETELYTVQTGGEIGRGRWVMQEALDVRTATIDIIAPVQRRIVDYVENPWQLVQWSSSTPADGIECELVVIDSYEALDKLPPHGLQGKIVLTNLSPYHQARRWYEKGALGVIVDAPVMDCPEATAWTKFGWGGVPVNDGAARLVGCVLSRAEGEKLRALVNDGPVRLKVQVITHRHVGTHDVVSGLVLGAGDPQDEVWAIAHSSEPGAADNAAGVAVCIEAVRILEALIAGGQLARPRRTVRVVFGYECYGFFHYLINHRRFQPPLAGICVDALGIKPEYCGGTLKFHATVPSSAGFVNELGEAMVQAALAQDDAGYTYEARPFISTEDTLIGDPRYGFPCPFITNYPYRGYHSSADTPEILHPRGLAVSTTAVAAYLYYLANAGSDEVRELASWHTDLITDKLQVTEGVLLSPDHRELLRKQHAVSMQRLTRWFWGGDRSELLALLDDCGRRVEAEVGGKPTANDRPQRGNSAVVPRRRHPLTYTQENMRPEHAARLQATGLPSWALYWADGERSLGEIARLLRAERSKDVSLRDVAAYFTVLAEMGWVELLTPERMVTREQLVADLAALGVTPGMDVMVHSSLSRLGHVVGGAEAVVEALLQAIGPAGTLMAPSFNHGAAAVYNPLATPTSNGAIADALWRRPDAIRSIHPTHPVAAIGPKASEWCRDHLENGIWAQDSPIGRLIHNGGYLLGLGVDNDSCTAYHVAEVSMPCGCLDPFGSRQRVVGADGTVRTVNGFAWRDGLCPVSPANLAPALDRRGVQRRGKVGHADCFLLKAVDLWQERREQLKDACPVCMIKPKADNKI